MKTQTLEDFVKASGQKKAAAILGVTQGRVSQILSESKNIFIETNDHGDSSFYEIRRPQSRKASADPFVLR